MKSIQARFVVLMIAIISVMLTAFGMLSYAESKDEKYKQLNNILRATKQRLSQSLPAVIWRFDNEQIQQIVDAELSSPGLVGIAVYDEKDRLLYSAPQQIPFPEQWTTTTAAPALDVSTFSQTVSLSMMDGALLENVGTVRLYGTHDGIEQALQKDALRLGMLILLMNLVIAVALIGAMRMVIMRPLNSLRNALRDIATEGADLSLRLPPSQWQEFSDVTHNFNAFAQRLELALGASIDEVHQTISRIARGKFDQPVIKADTAAEDTVIARLAGMQDALIHLTQELHQAKQRADAASQAKSDFLANMSHEIRTPLNAILGMTRLAMRGNLPAQQQIQLGKVIHSANHLLALINDILDFSKIEAGKLSLEHVPFELADVLANVITLVSERAADKNLELLTDIDEKLPWRMLGDALRLSQIMVNFTTNALKFTQRGEVLLYMHQLSSDAQKIRVRIGVRDTGIGIPADKQAILFQNFVQADTSNSRQYGGTGLGLAITRRLSELMNGNVGVQSIEGVGSDFWCEVELGCVDNPAANWHLTPSALQNQRALVIDPHATARELLVKLLRNAGLQARGIDSPAQALQALTHADQAGAAFNLVYIDRSLLQSHESSIVPQIHGLSLSQNPKLILLAGATAEALDGKAHHAGFSELLNKPFHAASVQRLLLRLSGNAQMPAATPTLPVGTQSLQAAAGARILLVEDIEINREVARGLLEDIGIGLQVDSAENGQVALSMLTQRTYDAILMDMHMPIMDGLSATQAIRRNADWDHIPIIAMTANHMESDIQRCKDVGMCDFVSKPIDPERLRDALSRWVIARKTVVQSTAAAAQPTQASNMESGAPLPVIAQRLENVPGLNAAQGLRSFGGRQATYREMLRRFIASADAQCHTIQTMIHEARWDALEESAHAMADTADHLGATNIANHARHLCTLARARMASADMNPTLQALIHSMQILSQATQQALPEIFAT